MPFLEYAHWKSPTLARLDAMARKLTGASLVLLRKKEDEIERLDLNLQPARISSFCHLLRASHEGKGHCRTCRRMLTLSAQLCGVSNYSCHGGIHVVVAPVFRDHGDSVCAMAVASHTFASEHTAEGWRQVRGYAQPLGVNLNLLREAYRALPRLTRHAEEVMNEIVLAAAEGIRELGPSQTHADAAGNEPPLPAVSAAPSATFQAVLDSFRLNHAQTGKRPQPAAVVDLVTAMVAQNPALPYTVSQVARAIHMTPNHFSTLFRKHTQQTFVDYLCARRMDLAKELLGNPLVNVAEVARRAGFTDAAYFSRRFRQITGVSPRDWRQEALEEMGSNS